MSNTATEDIFVRPKKIIFKEIQQKNYCSAEFNETDINYKVFMEKFIRTSSVIEVSQNKWSDVSTFLLLVISRLYYTNAYKWKDDN
ncbi:Uncharacterized protein FWK35_00005710 [Aphis craccivora]|uniref:Uncharacterized protein n=1 Tax=Aphis craccivora TaxID=307492 RepID=A0A6G0ZLD1_APHCR|nr:Uncharacterized protein FWK35_00005710 [Aphis craccivora]